MDMQTNKGGRRPGYISTLRKRPYEALYNNVCSQAKQRGYSVSISYKDFLKYTTLTDCHYCSALLEWVPFRCRGKRANRSNLDRKDNAIGYTTDNLVVCCPRCNRAKSNHFTYREWLGMASTLTGNRRTHTAGV